MSRSHLAHMNEDRTAHKVLIGKSNGGKKSLGRSRRRWENSLRMDFKEMEYENDEGRWEHRRDLIFATVGFRVPNAI